MGHTRPVCSDFELINVYSDWAKHDPILEVTVWDGISKAEDKHNCIIANEENFFLDEVATTGHKNSCLQLHSMKNQAFRKFAVMISD